MDKLKLKRYSEIILSALLALLGVAFIFSACHLYMTGGSVPYSRERVGEYLLWLLPLSIIVIILAGLVGVLSLGEGSAEVRSLISVSTLCKRRASRVDFEKISPENRTVLETERKRRLFLLISALSVVAIYAVITVVISLDFSRYTVATCTEDVAALSLIIFPPAIVIVGFAVVASTLYTRSLARASEIYKAELDGGNNGASPRADADIVALVKKNEERILLIARISLVAVAILLIVLGISNGTMADVLGKAVKICTECIGLG